MGKCPYCSIELHLGDFYEESQEVIRKKEIRIRYRVKEFKGELSEIGWTKMWVCPSCDTILGFTETAR